MRLTASTIDPLHGRRLCPGVGPDRGFAFSSSDYGGSHTDAKWLLTGACPIVASYGGKDHSPM